MENYIIIVICIINSLIGLAIGEARGRSFAGFFLGFLVGPLGWLLLLIGPNPKKEKNEKKKQALMQHQLAMQQAQLVAIQQMHTQFIERNVPPPPNGMRTIRIAKNGQDLGEIDISQVKLMLRNGELSKEDYFFDTECNDWLAIQVHPELVK